MFFFIYSRLLFSVNNFVIYHNINYADNRCIINCSLVCCISVVFVFFIIFPLFSLSQNFTDFTDTYKLFEIQKLDSVENFHQNSNKNHFTAYLPAISYNILNKDFRITYSINHIASLLKQSKRNKIELARLHQSYIENLENRINKFRSRYSAIYEDYTELLSELELLSLDYEIFSLKQKQYEKSKINYEQFLNAKRSYFFKKKSIANKANSIHTSLKMLLSDLDVSEKNTSKFWLSIELQKIFSSVSGDWKPHKSEV